MVRALTEVATGALLLIGVSLGIYVAAATLHERSHWAVGRLWSSDVRVRQIFVVFPVSVEFPSPYDVPPGAIRLAGAAPLLVCLPVGLALFTTLEASFRVRIVLALPFWAASILSPSDLLAVLFPRRFQVVAAEHEKLTHLRVTEILLEELRP